jgi:hypothetical protein
MQVDLLSSKKPGNSPVNMGPHGVSRGIRIAGINRIEDLLMFA